MQKEPEGGRKSPAAQPAHPSAVIGNSAHLPLRLRARTGLSQTYGLRRLLGWLVYRLGGELLAWWVGVGFPALQPSSCLALLALPAPAGASRGPCSLP